MCDPREDDIFGRSFRGNLNLISDRDSDDGSDISERHVIRSQSTPRPIWSFDDRDVDSSSYRTTFNRSRRDAFFDTDRQRDRILDPRSDYDDSDNRSRSYATRRDRSRDRIIDVDDDLLGLTSDFGRLGTRNSRTDFLYENRNLDRDVRRTDSVRTRDPPLDLTRNYDERYDIGDNFARDPYSQGDNYDWYNVHSQRMPPMTSHRSRPTSIPDRNTLSRAKRAEKSPRFDGKGDLTDFLVQFEQVAAWNEWTDTERATQILICLDGTAKQILSELTADKIGNYQAIRDFLINRFSPKERETAYRCEFKSRKRQKGESVQDYGYNLRRLALKGYPNIPYSAIETHVVDQFIQGIGGSGIKTHVQFRHPETLDKAIALAIEYESFIGSQDIARKPIDEDADLIGAVKTSEIEKLKSELTQMKEMYHRDIATIKDALLSLKNEREAQGPKFQRNQSPVRNFPKRSDGKEVVCFYCGKAGHIEPRCLIKQEEIEKAKLEKNAKLNQGN
ncbi:hypothetical protein FSP39_007169 [Pinctada imbricata]|uniref:CCHC-type domain-containing protein n=1 Tax=Pinctada imbricata TaxID=66713 RepID=A0AA89BWB1_PINIB|nr:hypothetical protein FSP39_007169 [Pinctada imbricata]